MQLDSGILTIYEKENTAKKGYQPRYTRGAKVSEHYYDEYSVGITEETLHMQRGNDITCKARIWQDKEITVLHLAQLEDGRICEINRVYHGLDDDGQPITDLTLGKVVKDDNNEVS